MATKAILEALSELSETGFRVCWKPDISHAEYLYLKDEGLIEEAWTWASTTRPDVRRTEAGTAILANQYDAELTRRRCIERK